MTEYNFRLLLEVAHEPTDAELDALYGLTDSEASFGSDDSGWYAEFDREAPDYASAVLSAIEQLDRAPQGIGVRKLASDEDALVSAAEIARRAELTRQAVNLYVDGERNRDLGPFPTPLATFASGQRIWRWGDVAPWIARATRRDVSRSEERELTAVLNDFLDLRRRMPNVALDARKALATAMERELAALSA
ncbi:MAG TPA: hypothetical protein VI814_09985 [Candidatus Limnocylindria bacterium]